MGRNARRWVGVLIGAAVLGVVALTWWSGGRPWAPFVGERRFHIPSEAMTPTLGPGDDIWASPLSNTARASLERGDIVVYDCGAVGANAGTCVSRVIGLGGENIEIVDERVFVDDVPLDEPYLREGILTPQGPGELGPVPDGHVVLLGDNRGNAFDSRYYGPVPLDRVLFLVTSE